MAKIKNESNVTPLIKEQLQEALLYIIKVSSKVRSTKENELTNHFFPKIIKKNSTRFYCSKLLK